MLNLFAFVVIEQQQQQQQQQQIQTWLLARMIKTTHREIFRKSN